MFHSGSWIGLPNIPYRHVFQQLSSKFLHIPKTPLKSRQSAKICTTVVWGTHKHKSRSSTCRRSKRQLAYTLPSCNPQCFKYSWKVLNITFFSITLYSLRFMIDAKAKPNNGLSGAAFSWAFFFNLWPTNRINFARFHLQTINRLKT